MTLNILILHALKSDQSSRRKAAVDRARCFERYAPDHRFFYHDISDPVTDVLRDARFHAVVFDTSAASFRVMPKRYRFAALKDRYSFIAGWDAVKVAFPQDEYDCSALLDDWLADYGFDVVYSAVWDHRAVLYPRMSRQGRILPALTGYVNDEDIEELASFARPFDDRGIDIGYRARFLPARFGRHGQIKGLLAERMQAAVEGSDLVTDISTDGDRVFLGDDWLRFLGDCRFCLGAESGSSVWDPRGAITDRTNKYLKQNPDAGFEEVEAACFPGEDGRRVFSAVSPRVFEAATVRCGQILVEGTYLEEMEPWVHYLPIDEQCETAPEILDKMRDREAMRRMIDACYDAIVATPRYRYSTHVAEVMTLIADLAAEKRVQGSSHEEVESLMARHEQMLPAERRQARTAAARMRRSIAKWRWRFRSMLPAG